MISIMSTVNMKEKIGFWILGLGNNFAYVIMLSAAMDILKDLDSYEEVEDGGTITNNNNVTNSVRDNNPRDCNTMSTGTVLLADVVPTILIKLFAPFFHVGIQIRMVFIIFFITLSFLTVALSTNTFLTFCGIIFAAIGGGLGETSLLSFSSKFDPDVIRYWSSGTGGAGIFGALAYAILTFFLSPRVALLTMLIVPVLMAWAFWYLVYPHRRGDFTNNYETIRLFDIDDSDSSSDSDNEVRSPIVNRTTVVNNEEITGPPSSIIPSLRSKFRLIPILALYYMLPLGFVYFFEYLINQGLFELLYFPKLKLLNHKEQYRWYQVDYQVGVFISRSSMACFTVNKIWVLSVLQAINFALLLPQAIYWTVFPSFWIILIFVFWEGLLGGAAYANTFRIIRQDVTSSSEDQEFALGITSLADSTGIAISALLAIPLHNYICNRPIGGYNY